MIRGNINAANRATIPVAVVGPAGQQQRVEVVVDTGFSGFLTLPPHLIITMHLVYERTRTLLLANNRGYDFASYLGAAVVLNGQSRPVNVLMKEGPALLGMALLNGYRLCLDITPNGEVHLEPLP